MPMINKSLQLFLDSQFYAKYKDTYYEDSILKNVFNLEVSLINRYDMKSYQQVVQQNLMVQRDLMELLIVPCGIDDEETIWQYVSACYIDPDGYDIRELGGVKCSVDGLISVRRIFSKYGLTEKFLSEYERYRKFPIIYFPQEFLGINMSRARVFGDRIDYTLYDLKRYYSEGIENTRLKSAYKLPLTKAWLEALGSFEALVEWLGIKGIFVNESYEIYDLEKSDGSVIREYLERYSWSWSDEYYENVKIKIDNFMQK